MRVTGGRTVVWGRQSYRMGDLDFKAASHDGFGVDWPLSYADLVPYYELVEDYVGISGLAEDALRAARQPVPAGDAVQVRASSGCASASRASSAGP